MRVRVLVRVAALLRVGVTDAVIDGDAPRECVTVPVFVCVALFVCVDETVPLRVRDLVGVMLGEIDDELEMEIVLDGVTPIDREGVLLDAEVIEVEAVDELLGRRDVLRV